MNRSKYDVSILLGLFILLLVIVFAVPNNALYKNTGKLVISEIMSSNDQTIKDKFGKSSDYIEIYNGYDEDINLEGYYLSDDSFMIKKWQFPSVVIKAHEYLLVFASDRNTVEDGELHTNFKLDMKGESVILADPDATVISKVYANTELKDTSYGYDIESGEYYYYYYGTPGTANEGEYSKSIITVRDEEITPIESKTIIKSIRINEVTAITEEAIELKNLTDQDIDLSGYAIGDKSGYKYFFKNSTIKANGYLVIYSSDKEQEKEGKVYVNMGINSTSEIIYLYYQNETIDSFKVNKAFENISIGIDDNNQKVYFENITLGSANTGNTYKGVTTKVSFSQDGGYVKDTYKLTLESDKDATIYFTIDGSYPTNKSLKYNGAITIDKTSMIKAIAYKDGYLPSEISFRTFFVNDTHDIGIVSITSNPEYLFGTTGLITNYESRALKQLTFEFYESDGSFGTSFIGEGKLSGNFGGSRDKEQRGLTVYLRKKYGTNTVFYPFFNNNDMTAYSSLLLRNGGEDYLKIHIFDAALQIILKGQMDIDMQDYRPVVVYFNGQYYGIYNLRDKLNTDYVANKYDVSKDEMDVIRYYAPTAGTYDNYKALIDYVNSHDPKDNDVYKYIKSQVDVQELINYWIVQSYYRNGDLGNIKYYKTDEGKWRFMLFDLDWSLYYTAGSLGFPITDHNVSAATKNMNVINLSRRLARNSEYRELYLKSFAYHLENTFKPERVNKIIDDLVKEIENEMPRHNERWSGTNSYLGTIEKWKSNVERLKTKLKDRYEYAKANVKTEFDLTDAEYNKYFGGLK